MSVKWMVPVAAGLLLLAACGTTPPAQAPRVVTSGAEQAIPNGVAKTFAANVGDVRSAVLRSLVRMDVRVVADTQTKQGWRILAISDDRTVMIQLESVTPTITRMRVVIDRGGWDEKATEVVWRVTRDLPQVMPDRPT
jgi:hypothetical protein